MATELDVDAIIKLVASLDPTDWALMRLMASLSPAERTQTWMAAAEVVRSNLRETFRQSFPELTESELNMKVLGHLTPIRMGPPSDAKRETGSGP